MSKRTWDQKYAFYAASLYRLGMYIDAGLVSAIMFERYIEDALNRELLSKSTQGDFLCDAIRKLSKKNRNRYNSALLHELRLIRNQEIIHPDKIFKGIMHDNIKKTVKLKMAKITQYIWKELDSETFLKYRELDKIPVLDADYAVMEIKELLQNDLKSEGSNTSTSITKSDFENLFSMRSKILNLADYANRNLLAKYNNLHIDVISRVDTTSAYVWLAINLRKSEGWKGKISGASASILATPLDFRIYLDFGGEAVTARKHYYKFLASENYGKKFIAIHDDESLKMFDIDWYCFKINDARAKDVSNSESLLGEQLSKAEAMLTEYEKKKQIITWNRNLIGFILPRCCESIKFDYILDKLETIIKLYYYFIDFRIGIINKNEKKVEPPWLPKEKDYLLHKTNKVLKGYKLL